MIVLATFASRSRGHPRGRDSGARPGRSAGRIDNDNNDNDNDNDYINNMFDHINNV